MINNHKVVVVLPAYNAAETLEKTVADIPREVVDEIILVDDVSSDETLEVAKRLGLTVHSHSRNLGYGGNQKTCYRLALEAGADIVIMVHPDYQYDPTLAAPMAYMIAHGLYDVVIGSRILGKSCLKGGMPLYKYYANRILTFTQNLLMNWKLTEYHTGLRAFHRRVIETLPLERNSDDFVFDNQMLTQVHRHGFNLGEVSCPTKYFKEASSINFKRSCVYGIGCLINSVLFVTAKMRWYTPSFLEIDGWTPADAAAKEAAKN